MKRAYPTFIVQDKKSKVHPFLVNVPDFDILTEGDDLADAIEMARDAIGICGITLEDNKGEIPAPSSIETAVNKIKSDAEKIRSNAETARRKNKKAKANTETTNRINKMVITSAEDTRERKKTTRTCTENIDGINKTIKGSKESARKKNQKARTNIVTSRLQAEKGNANPDHFDSSADVIDFTKGIITYVDVDFSEYRRKLDTKTVRRNVALSSWLDYEAKKAGINVSRVLQEALIKVLGVSR